MRNRSILAIVAIGSITLLGGLRLEAQPPTDAPFLVLQADPEESVTSVAVSPDGSLIATSSFDGKVRLHDARTGAMLRAIGSDTERGGRAVAFAPDGRSLAVAGFHMDKLVRLWDPRTGALVRTLAGHIELETYAVAFSPDGRRLASAGTDKQILVWDLATGTLRHRLEGQAFPITALTFHPDGATLASGGGDKVIRLWDSTSGRLLRTLTGHRNWINALAFSPDGKTLASGSCDWAYHRGRDPSRFEGRDPASESEWRLWEPATGGLRRAVTEPGRLLSLAFAPDGRSLACGIGKDVRLYEIRTEKPGRIVTSHDGPITSIAFSPEGGSLISSSHDRTVRRVTLPTGTVEWRTHGYWEQVNSVALSPDGSMIASGSSDNRFAERKLVAGARGLGPGAVRLWDARSGRLLRRLGEPADQVTSIAFSPDSRRLASGAGPPDGSGVVRLWDIPSGTSSWVRNDHRTAVLAVAFTHDGDSIASADADGSIKLRNAATGSELRTLAGHDGAVTSIASSTDGKTLVSGGADRTAHFWDVATGHLTRTFRLEATQSRVTSAGGERLITSVAVSSDGGTLATCSGSETSSFGDRLVRLWDTRTGRLRLEFQRPQNRGRFVALSPDGTTLASSGLGKAIALWDVRTGQLLRELVGHPHPPQSAAFSSDGKLLVSGADYRTVKVWEVESGRLLATLVTFSSDRAREADEDWLAITPDNIYDGSPGIDRFLAWRIGSDLWTADRLAARLHRPDRLQSTLKIRP